MRREHWWTLAGSVLVLTALAFVAWRQARAATGPRASSVWRYVAVADTDSVATGTVERPDTTGLPPFDPTDVESLRVAVIGDTTTLDTTRAATYFPMRRRDDLFAAITARRSRAFDFVPSGSWQREAELDSTEFRYTIRETVRGGDVRVPYEADLAGFQAALRAQVIEDNFRSLAIEQLRRRSRGRGGLGLTIDVPGGRGGAFETIFGKNEVALNVTGNANINLGFAYNQNEQQEAATGQGGRLNPDFAQELALGITGTIGDKLSINVNYDTQNTFEFENQVKLLYEGYDDDIIQRIEAGNVFLQTPSDLIRGGQRLFGIRTDLRFGGLGVTLVASQQDAEGDALEIEGGSQTTEFDIAPYEYEDNAHFFLGYYFRNRWDVALSAPPNIIGDPNFAQIDAIDVWLQDRTVDQTSQLTEGLAQAVALVDLAEPVDVLQGGDAYLELLGSSPPLPGGGLDQYSDADLEDIRTVSNTIDFQQRFGLGIADFADARFKKLTNGRDYVFNPQLGYLSLNRSLSPDERLAVAIQYRRRDGTPVTIGDFGEETGTDQNGRRIILKLLRSDNPVPQDASWGLTMRNIYRIGGRSLNPTDFDLDIVYQPSGQPVQETLPGVTIGQQRTLLTTLGLDRLDDDGRTPEPNAAFDFVTGLTINAGDGRVIFPYLEPFGARLREVFEGDGDLNGQPLAVQFSGAGGITDAAAATNTYAFETLYDIKQENANQFPGLDRYAIVGSYRSSVQESYSLGFAVVEGSVRVTSGGVELQEGSDYTVDYTSGEVIIVNRAYLTPGQNISIDYERNQFAAIGRKTLLGFRADYAVGDNLELGGTWMRLSERPLIDKYRIGEEPIDNTIFGFDGRYAAEPRWLTRLVDGLPLVQTKARSAFEIKGEYARFTPGHPETFAFEERQEELRRLGRSFTPDEQQGISFIDDFEGTENAFSLLQPGAWQLSAAPQGAGPEGSVTTLGALEVTDPTLATNWRGLFGWYTLQRFLYNNGIVAELGATAATRAVLLREIFANREVSRTESEFINPLDLYFDPTRRGPYNYNGALGTEFAGAPQEAWGGMVQRLPDGYNDFDGRNNIEFVEFIVAPYGGRNGTEPVSEGATLYIDLGQISEDVLPDGNFNTEDGLIESDQESGLFSAYGRLATGNASGSVDLDEASRQTEDLGLDGLRSAPNRDGGTPYAVAETDFFADFLATLGDANPLDRALAQFDPSGDDYFNFEDDSFFEDPTFFPNGEATVQERFSRFFPGVELNAFESQQQFGSGQGNSTFPDDEDVDRDNSSDRAESFYRYAVPLSPSVIDVPCAFEGQDNCNPFFVNRVGNEGAEEWVLIRIPVRSDVGRSEFGGIEDFSRVETIRLWTDGHQVPTTLRFATFDLVGSQWLKSDLVGFGDDLDRPDSPTVPNPPPVNALDTQLFIATVNNEENPNQYATPRGALVSRSRDVSGELIEQREQAIVVRAEELGAGQSRGIYRSYSGQLDFTKYSNLRVFVHGENFDREQGDSLRVFVRLGTNETVDYYEIEQPVYPYEPEEGGAEPDLIWQTNVLIGGQEVDRNSINVVLSALNQLKVERNNNPDVNPAARYLGAVPPPDTPAGARLFIRGNPSIESINTIVLGIRNVGATTLDPEVWFNELRVSGYDEEPGWSAYGTVSLDLADLATVRARVERQTEAFGDLSSGLGDRTFTDQQAYTLNTTFNADKLLPERMGVRLPVTVSVQQRTSTPRFSPRRGGDIRLDDLIEQAQNDPNLDEAQRDSLVALYREESETVSYTRTISVPFSKSGSRSPWLRYTIDGLSVSYSNTLSERRSPSERFSNSESWNTSLRYRLQPRGVKTVRPFWLLDGAPLIGILAELQLNLLPQSFSFQADAARSVSENQQRLPISVDESVAAVPERFRNAIRENHVFTHRRNLDFAYNPFNFLALGYRSDVNQTLSAIGADRTNDTFVIDSTGAPAQGGAFNGLTPDEVAPLIDPTFEDANDLADNGFRTFTTERLDVVPVFGVVGDVVGGQRDVQTDRYGQTFTATLTPRFQGLRWFRPQPIAYSSAFQWTFQPLAPVGGEEEEPTPLASVSNALNLRTGLTLGPREFLRQFGFYKNIEDAQEAYSAERRRLRTAREAAQDRLAEAQEEAEELGEELTEEDLERLAIPDRAGPPSPVSIARQAFLAVTGISDLTVTYNGGRTTQSGAIDGSSYNLLDALAGNGPSLGYRLGFRDRPQRSAFDPDVLNNLQVNDVISRNNDVQTRTSLELTRNLRIDLNWTLGWDRSTTFSFTTVDQGDGTLGVDQASPIENGGNSATVWALGGSYDRFVEAHRDRFQGDVAAGRVTEDGEPLTTALSNNGLSEDFRSAFTSSFGSFGPNNFFALPLPNWSVSYNGLGNWPLFNLIAQQVTLRHGYSATYDLDYRSDARVFEDAGFTESETIDGEVFQVPVDSRQSESVRLNERFQPLIGFNMTLRGGIQADINFTRSRALSLSVAGANVSESNTDEVSVRLSFSKTGLRIPLPFLNRRRINNNVRMSLTFSTANNIDQRLDFRDDFLNSLQGLPPEDPQPLASTRLTLEPRVSYTISSQVTADVFVRYTSLDSEGSQIPSTSTLNGGFNFRVSFSN